MSYQAIVATITTRPHPNADRLKIGNAHGHQIIVGLDTQDGELGVFFPPDGQLSEIFAKSNDLIRRKNADGTNAGGMFDENRRVRAQAFRGVKSEGFWCPVAHLNNAGVSLKVLMDLKDGDTFDTLNGVPICNKYYTPATQRAMQQRQTTPKRVIVSFPEHVETEQYKYVKDTIPADSLIIITEKLHGTSGRYGNVRVERKLKWYERVAQWFGVRVDTHEYQYVIGTRRTILADDTRGFYGNEQFRRNVVSGITLNKDEVLYFEIVGYTTDGRLIMCEQGNVNKVGSDFVRTYGDTMRYAYGCKPGECRMYVYRITQNGVELSYFDMVRRCRQLGLVSVPHLFTLHTLYSSASESLTAMRGILDDVVDNMMDGGSTLDTSHIREGVVLRVENISGTQFIKSKSWVFKVLEGIIKDSADYVDAEEVA